MKPASPKISFQGIYEVITPLKGALIYPALGSPEVVGGDQDLNILICLEFPLPDSGDGAKKALSLRLKFMDLNDTRRFQVGLDRGWQCHGAFPFSLIREINPLEFGGDPIISFPKNGFTAHLNPKTLKFFREGKFFDQRLPESIHLGFKNVYHVAVSSGIFAWMKENLGADLAAKSYLNWLSTGSAPTAVLKEAGRLREPEEESVSWLLRNFEEDGRNIFVGKRVKDASDAAQKRHTGLKETDPPVCLYDIFNFQFKPDIPFAPLHPVFHFPEERPLNVAYISDLHVVSRMQVLKESNLSIIPGASPEDSPRLCDQMSTPGGNVRDLISKAARDVSIDILVVGGDLIDFAQSCFAGDKFLESRGPDSKIDFRKVHAAVNADDDNYSDLYDHGVDYMAIFDLLSSFPKPVFILSGNHDSYDRPFGISPRFAGKLANEGIPADANLTIMEACLLYGENFGLITKKFNFNPRIAEIFPLLFSPVISFTGRIGAMQWVSLGWGTSEDMLWDGPETMPGHLPNADTSMTKSELALLEEGVACSQGKKGLPSARCLLLSHYTFASYDPQHTLLDGRGFNLPLGDNDDVTWGNVGTCMRNRGPVYKHFADGKIHCAVSGHAHRAGLYCVEHIQSDSANVRGYDVERFGELKTEHFKNKAVLLGADSAGPIPRENNAWEFGGWGSNRPSMLKLVFGSNGLQEVERVFSHYQGTKPRLAVAMDYLETLVGDGKKFWLETIETVEFGVEGKAAYATRLDAIDLNVSYGKFTKMDAKKTVDMLPDGLELKSLTVYIIGDGALSKQKLVVKKVGQDWKIDAKELITKIKMKLITKVELSGFMSVRITNGNSSNLGHYDEKEPWVQRVNISISSHQANGQLWKIRVKRNADWTKMKKEIVGKYLKERNNVHT